MCIKNNLRYVTSVMENYLIQKKKVNQSKYLRFLKKLESERL